MFYTYVIQSLVDKTLYVGMTNNLEDRIKRHNKKIEEYTSRKAPWDLLFYAAFKTRVEASNFEKYLKSGSGREFIKKRIKE